MRGVNDTGLAGHAPLSLLCFSETGTLAASAGVPAAVPQERDPALQHRGNLMCRQQLLPGWDLIGVLLVHKDAHSNELQNASQRLRLSPL